ncbi:type I-D CRISPR-associated protein Cas7/Csc2 [Litorilinea aerophila]|uniref:Type I-D CRISPR-associated protein Cas7/Csc2 n=1 Tax=Litorilinea aerophila TaxID=1204385 RepID=A0A540VD26_9CHLR|nr:type I-D CRISPR-associated protein Cas7/Csc2 [Litorilinea aerophila]MCC9078141.1 type I-D CRISPR-associated protein Cas7/Csc2 [Litorilinea aerophila]
MILSTLEKYSKNFVPTIPRTPTNRYASIILLRETKSYAIFTTEGGEQQDVEQTPAGLSHPEPTTRLVMFKRKQVAPERRMGKALLRQYGIFPYAIQNGQVVFGEEALAIKEHYEDCYLTEGLCTHCPDCLIYGYAAVEGEGARKARLMTDTCFSVRPYELVQKQVKFNVIDEAKHTSGTITEYDYTVPGVFLPAVETTVDLTADEFVYVLGNILRTPRYGKEGTRQGFVRNHVLAIAFSDVELFANLEFTQALYDAFMADDEIDMVERGLSLVDFQKHANSVIETLTQNVAGRVELVTGEELQAILEDVRALNRDETRFAQFLKDLHVRSATFTV